MPLRFCETYLCKLSNTWALHFCAPRRLDRFSNPLSTIDFQVSWGTRLPAAPPTSSDSVCVCVWSLFHLQAPFPFLYLWKSVGEPDYPPPHPPCLTLSVCVWSACHDTALYVSLGHLCNCAAVCIAAGCSVNQWFVFCIAVCSVVYWNKYFQCTTCTTQETILYSELLKLHIHSNHIWLKSALFYKNNKSVGFWSLDYLDILLWFKIKTILTHSED